LVVAIAEGYDVLARHVAKVRRASATAADHGDVELLVGRRAEQAGSTVMAAPATALVFRNWRRLTRRPIDLTSMFGK
jgi:hypothetical protein